MSSACGMEERDRLEANKENLCGLFKQWQEGVGGTRPATLERGRAEVGRANRPKFRTGRVSRDSKNGGGTRQ